MTAASTSTTGKAVIISTFPPLRDGIALYAEQQKLHLESNGTPVFTIGLPGSDADVVFDLRGESRILQALPYCTGASRVLLHWHDEFYFDKQFKNYCQTNVALHKLFTACPQLEVVCHETYPTPLPGGVRGVLWSFAEGLRKRAWGAAPRVAFHSDAERERMEKHVGITLRPEQVMIVDHGEAFRKFRTIDRPSARRDLEVPRDKFILLCIGFMGEHKGFHRAVEAYKALPAPVREKAQLYIVGSALYDDAGTQEYIKKLRELCERTPGAYLHEKYTSNEEFDTWLSACDAVAFPYTAIFSSGVVERAKLFERPLFVSNVGGLPSQAGSDAFVFDTEAELSSELSRMIHEKTGTPCGREEAEAAAHS